MIDSWDTAAAAYERALSLWRAAGDPLREGDVLCRLSSTLWRLCRGREAGDAAEAAVRVLEPLGPSVELARAYASVAATWLVRRGSPRRWRLPGGRKP